MSEAVPGSEFLVRGSDVRAALDRAEVNVDLHVERDVFEPNTAKAVVQEFREQLGPLLGPVERSEG